MEHWLRRALPLLWVVALAFPAAGWAQSASERAEKTNEQGKQLFEAGQFEDAAALFREAFEGDPKSKYVFNLAYALNSANQLEESKTAFQQYLELCRKETGNQCPDEGRVQGEIERIDDILFKSLPKVFVSSTPEGANVFFTDQTGKERLVGQTPMTLRLAQGSYGLRLEKEGYDSLKHTFEVQRIGDVRISFPLARMQNLGTILIESNVRGARIFVDGTIFGLTPRSKPLEVQSGSRQVVVEKEGYGRVTREVLVESGQQVVVEANLTLEDSPATWRSYTGWPLFTVGVLGIGTGILFSQLANEEFRGTPTFDDYELYQNLGYGLGGGLAAVGMSLLIWEWADPAKEREGDSIGMGEIGTPVFGLLPKGGAAFGWTGSF